MEMTEGKGSRKFGLDRQRRGSHVIRKCPRCGCVLYEKLGSCAGEIEIKCPKCGRVVKMNLAMRRTQGTK